MSQSLTIELFNAAMKYSAGHFTILSATERENLHGHNFSISVAFTGQADNNGLLFDYGPVKQQVITLCQEWNETFLLPSKSPYLVINTNTPGEIVAHFNSEIIRFLPRDVTILPIQNATIEELARAFGEQLVTKLVLPRLERVQDVLVKCASGPGQWASWTWTRQEDCS